MHEPEAFSNDTPRQAQNKSIKKSMHQHNSTFSNIMSVHVYTKSVKQTIQSLTIEVVQVPTLNAFKPRLILGGS